MTARTDLAESKARGKGTIGRAMIEHLRGRERALEPLGWTGREAEWIALEHSFICVPGQTVIVDSAVEHGDILP